MASIQQLIVDQKKELIFSNKEPVFETFEGETHSFVIDSSEPHRQLLLQNDPKNKSKFQFPSRVYWPKIVLGWNVVIAIKPTYSPPTPVAI